MLDRIAICHRRRRTASPRWCARFWPSGRSTAPVGRDDDLTESGLSSLDMVNLMLAVEAEFDVKIPDRDMTPANFRTIARIDALVGALLQNA